MAISARLDRHSHLQSFFKSDHYLSLAVQLILDRYSITKLQSGGATAIRRFHGPIECGWSEKKMSFYGNGTFPFQVGIFLANNTADAYPLNWPVPFHSSCNSAIGYNFQGLKSG